MLKAAFVNASEDTVRRVYWDKHLRVLREHAELLEGVFTSIRDERLRNVNIIFSTWGMIAESAEEIRRFLPNLQMVFYAAGSVQYFAKPYFDAGARIFSAWNANAVPVVQYAFAQISLALKGYFTVQQKTRTSRMEARRIFDKYPGLYGVKVGLLGCGAIGSRVAEMLQQLDVEVLVFDPFLSDARANALHVRKTDMTEIFSSCMVISNHLANLPETVGIIRREYFLSMLPYSTFINTGRGQQLDEKDLMDMLTIDPTRTALIDVMTEEQFSDTNPLNALPNCFITPHIAGSSGREVARMADYMVSAFLDTLQGKPSPHEVTPAMLATMA